jgi:WD40 repeat protein
MISVSHEVFVNVYSPESQISDVLIGRLRGHAKPVSAASFISSSPFLVTTDVEGHLRMWDIRSFNCVQLIRSK